MFMNERDLLFLTTHYYKLQRLRLAPLFVLFIASPWTDLRRVSIGMGLIALGICFSWYLLLNEYYKRHFGRIERKSVYDRRYFRVLALSYLPFVLYFMIRGQHFLPGLFLLFTASIVLAEAFSSSNIPLRRNYYVLASTLLFLVFIPQTFGYGVFFQNLDFDISFFGLVGLALSILDHMLLLSFFRRMPGDSCLTT
jgi:hypothetical protein